MVAELSIERGRIIGEQLIRLRRQIDALELEFARLASDFEDSEYFDEEGFTTPLNWIRVNCHMNAPFAADRVAVGDRLDRMPESVQAMRSGELGFAHLIVMARTAQAVGSRFDESELIDKARESTPGKFHHHCDHYRHAKDPVRFAQDQAKIIEHRQLELRTWANGVLSLKGYLDPVGGAAFRSTLESLMPKAGWVTPDAFLAGYGAAQAVPGPLFTVAAYLGAVATLPPNGLLGAAIVFEPGLPACRRNRIPAGH